MTKRNRIIYWVATIWLTLGMLSTGMVQILQIEEEKQKMNALGYPMYFLTIIGIWKLLGVLAVLIPRYPLLKEWAYAEPEEIHEQADQRDVAISAPARTQPG